MSFRSASENEAQIVKDMQEQIEVLRTVRTNATGTEAEANEEEAAYVKRG